MRHPGLLALLLAVAGCSGAPAGPPPDAGASALALGYWEGLDAAAASMSEQGDTIEVDPVQACADAWGTWFHDFGARGLACTAAQVMDPSLLVEAAPVRPFRSGPHAAYEDVLELDLTADRAFGHYDPAFVEWVAGAFVPGTAVGRAALGGAYRRHVARLARTYWLTLTDLEAEGYPGDLEAPVFAGYASFLEGGPVPAGAESYEGAGYSVFAFTDRSETLLPDLGLAPGENEWEAKYEANTAYGFWLRRAEDGTHDAWAEGLEALLEAFDADWLAAHGG